MWDPFKLCMTIYLENQMKPSCPRWPTPMEMLVAELVTSNFKHMQVKAKRQQHCIIKYFCIHRESYRHRNTHHAYCILQALLPSSSPMVNPSDCHQETTKWTRRAVFTTLNSVLEMETSSIFLETSLNQSCHKSAWSLSCLCSFWSVLSIITTCLGQQFVVHRILKMRGEPYPSTSAPRAIPHVQETL